MQHEQLTIIEVILLPDPQFVGSLDIGEDIVLFFFREIALEYQHCGRKIFSRVGKVCKVTH